MTHCWHELSRNPASQQSLPCYRLRGTPTALGGVGGGARYWWRLPEGEGHAQQEAARVHHPARRRDSVPARRARAAAGGDANDWVCGRRLARSVGSPVARVPFRLESDWLYRRPECGDQLSLVREP